VGVVDLSVSLSLCECLGVSVCLFMGLGKCLDKSVCVPNMDISVCMGLSVCVCLSE